MTQTASFWSWGFLEVTLLTHLFFGENSVLNLLASLTHWKVGSFDAVLTAFFVKFLVKTFKLRVVKNGYG